MAIDLSRFRDTFFEEAAEHLAAIEAGLLALDANTQDGETLHAIFRAAHSIKGAGGTFGFQDVTRFTHAMESLLDAMREGRIPAAPHVNLLLTANDVLTGLISVAKDGGSAPADLEAVLTELNHAMQQHPAALASAPAPLIAPGVSGPTATCVYRVQFAPNRDVLRQGMDPLLLLRDLARLGENGTLRSVQLQLADLPPLAALDPECCYVAWDVLLATTASRGVVEEVFLFVDGSARLVIEPQPESVSEPTAAPEAPGAGDARAAAHVEPAHAAPNKLDTGSIRVSIEKIDRLVNLVEELVISQSMLVQSVAGLSVEERNRMNEAVGVMERNIRDLQERVMAMRMVPIASIAGRFPRVVRELAAKLGKEITFEIVGQETELDRQVVERISDPLMHLLRNAVDHGLEPPEERLRLGKPAAGHVRLMACQQGDNILIEISDDGWGLNTERIRQKAISVGLVGADEALSETDIHALIFAPGFSTASQVTDVSGRGVGMDVVRKNVEALNGAISIISKPGHGSRFRIKLPLTVAILDGLCLGLGEEVFILPLLTIVESLRPRPEAVKTLLGRGTVVLVRGETLPLLRLDALLGIQGNAADPTQGLVVIVESDNRKCGVLVDELLGQSQVVIKNLEANYRKVEGIAGATILGDGRVALILDVPGLSRLAHQIPAAAAPSFM